MAKRPVAFDGMDDFRRAARATHDAEAMRRNTGAFGPNVGAGGSVTGHVRVTDPFNADAGGWPGLLTYRNFKSESPSEDWIDAEFVYAEDINGADLVIGRRYDCVTTAVKPWTHATEGDVESVFVQVDVGAGGGGGGFDPTACLAVAGWTYRECLTATVGETAGICSDIDATQVLTLTRGPADDGWSSGDDAVDDPEDDFDYDDGLGPMVLWIDGGQPHLSIDGVEGLYLGCSDGSPVFGFGEPLCAEETYGDRVNCDTNAFTIILSCECCDVPGYTTTGLYRVLPLGMTCADACSGACRFLSDRCDAGNWVICDGPLAGVEECLEDEDCPPDPPPGDWQCAPGQTATLSIGDGTGLGALFQISPTEWQTADGWILKSPGFAPPSVAPYDCVGNSWILYGDFLGSCVHCSDGETVVEEGPLFGCMILSDTSGGGQGPNGEGCASESYVCCDAGEELFAALAAGKPITVRTVEKSGGRKPCRFEGKELTGAEREPLGLGQSAKRWRLCLYDGGAEPSKAVVKNATRVTCRCMGCGPRCDKYHPTGNGRAVD